MAEGYGRKFLGQYANVFSGGILAHGVNPKAIAVMQEDGVDIASQTSKVIDPKILANVDLVVTLCGDARDTCPSIPNQNVKKYHWDLIDPAKVTGNSEQILNTFRSVRDEIKQQVLNLKNELS